MNNSCDRFGPWMSSSLHLGPFPGFLEYVLSLLHGLRTCHLRRPGSAPHHVNMAAIETRKKSVIRPPVVSSVYVMRLSPPTTSLPAQGDGLDALSLQPTSILIPHT